MRWLWLLVMIGLMLGSGVAQQASITAVVRVVEHQKEGTQQWLPSKIGTSLSNGDRVRTGKRSYAEITFADKSVVKLNERSELTVASTAALKQEMELHRGSLWARFVKGTQSTIRAKTTVAAIRGTTVLIAIQRDGSVLIRVLEGLLEVTNLQTGEQVTIEAGNEIVAPADPTAPLPSPRSAPPPQFGSDPIPTDQPFTEVVVSGERNLVTTGSPDFPSIQMNDPALAGTNPSVPEVGSIVSPGGTALPAPPTGNLEVVVRSRQAILETSGLALTSDTRPRRIAGFQLRPRGTVGNLFYSVSVLPIAGTGVATKARLTEAYIAYKDEEIGTLRFGRQWFSSSPVTASLTGKLVINDIADAVSWQRTFDRIQVSLAYLYDAEPFAAGRRQGAYLHLAHPLGGGYIGVSGLKMEGSTIGYALDFSQPIIPNELELYGELGKGFVRDPNNPNRLRRGSFYTLGLYFPSLYQRYDIDLFVEYTKAPSGAPVNNLFSIRAFHTIFPGLKLVFIGQRRGSGILNSGIDWTVGLIYTTKFALR